VAKKIDEELGRAGFSGRLKELPELLNFTLDSLRSSVEKQVPAGTTVPNDLPGIEAIAKVGTWEDTDIYRSSAEDCQRAKNEIRYVEDIKEGKVQVPDSLKDTFIKAVNIERNHRIIAGFEAKETEYHQKNAAATHISVLLQRYMIAEAIRGMRANMSKEKPFPVVLTCHKLGGKWSLELLLPASDGVVRDSYAECIKNASEDAGLRNREDKASENLVSKSWLLPGNIQSGKEASKKQDQFAFEFASTFKGCPLQLLGVQMRMTKMMDVAPSTERVELRLSSHDEDGETEPANGHRTM
jgi:hypothetical protein